MLNVIALTLALTTTPAPSPMLKSIVAYRSEMADRTTERAIRESIDARLLRDALFPEAVTGACWKHFFRDTIVDVGRMKSDRPVAFFYNPLVDVAAIVEFEAAAGTWKRRGTVTIVPGEAFGETPQAPIASRPAWQSSPDMFAALKAATRSRVRAFSALHPRGESRRAASLLTQPVSDAQRTAAELRILNELRALANASDRHASTLERALAAVHAASPKASPRLEISAVYSQGGSPALVLVSLPDDGRRFAVVSIAALAEARRAVAFVDLLEDPS